jgi:hypothetical protein
MVVIGMNITNTGNVGIGTTSPSQKLHVVGDQLIFGDLLLEGSANSFRTVSMNTSDGSDNQTLSLCGGATASSARGGRVEIKGNEADGSVVLVAGNVSTGDIDFYTANSQRMIINNAGNVGIGTTSPARPLHVNGISTVARFQGSQTGYTQGSIVLHSGTADSPSSRGQGTYRYNEGSDICWYTGTAYSDTNKYIWARRTGVTSFATDAGEGTAQASYALMTLVGSTGNVGIGTTSPSRKLEVAGDLRVDGLSSGTSVSFGGTGDFAIDAPGVGGGRFIVKHSSGNVGIGNTSPAGQLDILTSSETMIKLRNSELHLVKTGILN